MQARKINPSLPAVEAYYNGLKVSPFRNIVYEKFWHPSKNILNGSIYTAFTRSWKNETP